jgi:hypothetical protein
MSKKLIPEQQVARRYSVHPQTLKRWDNDSRLDFPKPIKIRGRLYRDEAELDQFDRRMAEAESEPPLKTVHQFRRRVGG